MIPIESLEGITIMGQSQMTAKMYRRMSEKEEFRSSIFQKGGVYFGRVMSTSHIKRWKTKECKSALYDTEFAVELGKKNFKRKRLKNQSVVLRRYEKKSKYTS